MTSASSVARWALLTIIELYTVVLGGSEQVEAPISELTSKFVENLLPTEML